MNNMYPRMLYRQPGTEEIHGGLFATRIVTDGTDQDQARAEGWCFTTDEAKLPPALAGDQVKVEGIESAPVTAAPELDEVEAAIDNQASAAINDRESLKAEATELGLVFAKNIPTDKLAELIAEAKNPAPVTDAPAE